MQKTQNLIAKNSTGIKMVEALGTVSELTLGWVLGMKFEGGNRPVWDSKP